MGFQLSLQPKLLARGLQITVYGRVKRPTRLVNLFARPGNTQHRLLQG